MGSWEFAQVGARVADKRAEKLAEQALICFGIDFSAELQSSETGTSGLYEPSIEGVGWLKDSSMVFSVLNRLFGKVWLYTESETGSNTMDAYQRSEYVYDPEEMMCFNYEVDYCYGDGTAFGEEVEEDDDVSLEELGQRLQERNVKFKSVPQEVKDALIQESTKRGFTELTALILEKLTIDQEIVKDDDDFKIIEIKDFYEEDFEDEDEEED